MIYKPLGQFVRLSQGLAINKSTNHLVSANENEEFCYPLLRIADMMENRFTKFISKEVNPTVVASQNDIIYTRTGQIGLVFRGYKGVVHNNSFIIKLINDEIDENYLYTLLQSNFVRTQALKLAKNSVQPDLTHEMFKSIMIPIPENKIEQIEISKSYNTIVKIIKTNNEIISELESLAKTIYDYWFLQFEFPNEDGKPYKSSGGKMVWNEDLKREIPEGWSTTNVGNITTCLDSKRVPLSSKDRENMKGSYPYYGATSEMDSVNEYLFDGDFVLLAEDGSVMDDKGFPILQRINGKVWVNNHAHVLQPKKPYRCKLLMFILKSIPVSMIKTGSIQMKVNQENLNAFKVLSFPENIIEKANSILDPIDTKIIMLQQENRELASLRDFLLPMLMNGQVTFKD